LRLNAAVLLTEFRSASVLALKKTKKEEEEK
jgi:hypothetical protein